MANAKGEPNDLMTGSELAKKFVEIMDSLEDARTNARNATAIVENKERERDALQGLLNRTVGPMKPTKAFVVDDKIVIVTHDRGVQVLLNGD